MRGGPGGSAPRTAWRLRPRRRRPKVTEQPKPSRRPWGSGGLGPPDSMAAAATAKATEGHRAAEAVAAAGWSGPSRSVQVIAQTLGAGRVAQLRHGLRLDLADALPGHPVDLTDLVEGLRLAVGEAEPHRDDRRLP